MWTPPPTPPRPVNPFCYGQGRDLWYPGAIMSVNERDGVVLSYRVRYDDAEEERAVRRSFIRVDEKVMVMMMMMISMMISAKMVIHPIGCATTTARRRGPSGGASYAWMRR
jgi:hypothetical protein